VTLRIHILNGLPPEKERKRPVGSRISVFDVPGLTPMLDHQVAMP
jgi:hypothetical protein